MFSNFLYNISSASLWDVIDILLVAFLFYKLMKFLRNTYAQKLFQGLLILAGVLLLSGVMQLNSINWLMLTVMQV